MILLLYILSSKYGIAELALVPFEINVPLITTIVLVFVRITFSQKHFSI